MAIDKMYYEARENVLITKDGMTKHTTFIFSKKLFALDTKWLGITKRTAYMYVNGNKKVIGKPFYGNGDMREPFFRYLGAA